MQAQLVTLLDRGERGPRAAVSASRGSSTGPSFAWLLCGGRARPRAESPLSLVLSGHPPAERQQFPSSTQRSPGEAGRPGLPGGRRADAHAARSLEREAALPPAPGAQAHGSFAFAQPCSSSSSLILALVANREGSCFSAQNPILPASPVMGRVMSPKFLY